MSRPIAPRTRATAAVVLALTALAFALRLYRLELQSLWWDEGISIYLAGLDLASLTSRKDFGVDLHPPLYHVLLAAWRVVAGSSVFAMRFLSVAAGTLLVPLVFVLGRRALGSGAGLVAAALTATSPVLVFYSQEARMYSAVPLLGLLSLALTARILAREKASPFDLAAVSIVNAAGLYTYYYLGLIILAESLAVLVVVLVFALGTPSQASRLRRMPDPAPAKDFLAGSEAAWQRAPDPGERTLSRLVGRGRSTAMAKRGPTRLVVLWGLAQVATVALYGPWLLALRELFASGAAMAVPPETAVHHTLTSYLRECFLTFGVGFWRHPEEAKGVALLVLALAGLGAIARPRSRAAWWLVALGIGVGLAGAYAISLRRPFFYPRFIIFVAPLLYLLVGGGVAALWRVASSMSKRESANESDRQAHHPSSLSLGIEAGRVVIGVGASVAVVGALAALLAWNRWSLGEHYTHLRTGYSSSDYRVVLATLAAHARPGDVVVGTYPWQAGYVAGYLPNAGLTVLHATGAPGSRYWTDGPALLRERGRVWLLLYSADGHWAEDRLAKALAGAGRPALVDQHGDSRAWLFASAPLDVSTAPRARLGGQIGVLAERVSPDGALGPGQKLDLTVVWQALGDVRESYTVFTHVLGPDGKVWAQQDSPPLQGARPTETWRAGEVVVDRYRLELPASAPAGEYLAEVGMYLPSTGQRLPVGRSPDEADRLILGRFRVVR